MKKDLTVSEASRTLGVTLDAIYRLIYAAKLQARKTDGKWYIPAAAIEARRKARAMRKRSTVAPH